MKKDKLTPRAIARNICRAHNRFRQLMRTMSMMDEEAKSYWNVWVVPFLLGNPIIQIPLLPRLMTHAEARKLVAEQS